MFLGVLLGLGLGALFSSGCLVNLAERQGIGGTRDAALGTANAVDRMANFFSLNRPADGLSAALDRDRSGTSSEEAQKLLELATADPSNPQSPPENPRDPSSTQPPSEGGEGQENGGGGTGSEDGAGSREGGATDPAKGGDRIEDPEGGTTGVSANPTPTSGPGLDRYSRLPLIAGIYANPTSSTSGPDKKNGPTDTTDFTTTSGLASGTYPVWTNKGTAPTETTTSTLPTSPSSTQANPPEGGGNGNEPTTTTTTEVPLTTTTTTLNPPPPPPSGPPVCPNTQAENLSEEFVAPRSPTPEEPLRVFIGGDSIGRNLADGIQRLAPRELTKIEVATKASTGLSRPDFYDWPARLADELTENRPDVIVLMFGANDFQNVMYQGRGLSRFKQEWTDLYCQRVAQAMRLVSQPGIQVIWVGQPIVRESTLADGLARLNAIYEAQSLLHPSVTFVDTWTIFSAPGGEIRPVIGRRTPSQQGRSAHDYSGQQPPSPPSMGDDRLSLGTVRPMTDESNPRLDGVGGGQPSFFHWMVGSMRLMNWSWVSQQSTPPSIFRTAQACS